MATFFQKDDSDFIMTEEKTVCLQRYSDRFQGHDQFLEFCKKFEELDEVILTVLSLAL